MNYWPVRYFELLHSRMTYWEKRKQRHAELLHGAIVLTVARSREWQATQDYKNKKKQQEKTKKQNKKKNKKTLISKLIKRLYYLLHLKI